MRATNLLLILKGGLFSGGIFTLVLSSTNFGNHYPQIFTLSEKVEHSDFEHIFEDGTNLRLSHLCVVTIYIHTQVMRK